MQGYVSVIIPVFNRITYLTRAIESVLSQTHRYFEIIIIDDNSLEDIKTIIDKFHDNKIIYIRNNKNMGVSYSRNIGIKRSKYDLIALLDSDDEWLPKKLEFQIKYLKEHPEYDIVHTEEIWIRNGKRVNPKKKHQKSGGDIFERSLELCLMSPSSILLKRSVFDKHGLFDETLPVCEDYDMWLRILAFEETGYIETPLIIKYGGHSDQLSRKYHSMDKYRVMSLMKIYKNENINKIKKEAIRTILLNKTKILLNGAMKRDNKNDIALYKSWINEYK